MKYKILFTLLLICLALPMMSAATYQQNKPINFNQACFNNGAYCDTSFTCNLTVQDFQENVIVNNQPMTRNGSFYNYTIPPQSQMGIYPSPTMSCTNSTVSGAFTGDLEITGDGNPYTSFPVVYLIMLLAIVLFIINSTTRKVFDTNILRIFSGILFMISGIITLYPGFNYTNYSTLIGLSAGVIFIGLGGIILTKELESYI